MFASNYHIIGLEVPVYNIFMALTLGMSFTYLYLKEKRYVLSWDSLILLFLIVAASAQIGAPLFAAFESTIGWQHFLSPSEAFESFTSVGSNFYGGLILSGLGLLLATKLLRLPALWFFDDCAIALCLGIAIGRLGCFFSVDGCYGIASDLPWAMSFPTGLYPVSYRVHPTPLYDAVWGLSTFSLLHWLSSRAIKKQVDSRGVFSLGVIGFYSFFRFVEEFVRRNPKYAGLSQAQWISLALLSIVVIIAMSYKTIFKSRITAILFR
jgi:phosphatidylglycerol:prolipoprotein diacylglycerol transferase